MKKLAAASTVALAAAITVRALAVQPASRLQLQFEDYAQLPITGELDGQNTRGQLARVNGVNSHGAPHATDAPAADRRPPPRTAAPPG